MQEIILKGVKYTNIPNKKSGTKVATMLTLSNIGLSQSVIDYINSNAFYSLINSIDIDWNGIQLDEGIYINDTSDLINWIKSIEKAHKDKEYNSEHFSGLGRKTLLLKNESNILTQEDFDQENTIYVISNDFDLNNAEITIPEGCVLEFDGGSLKNGLITSTDTYVKNYTIDCISNLFVVGGFIPMESNSHNTGKTIYTLECFGDYRSNAYSVFSLALHNASNRIIYVNEDITINQNGPLNIVSLYTTLASQNNSKITFTGTVTFYASSYLTIKDIHLHFDTPAQTDQLFVSGSNHILIENIEMSGTINSSENQRYGGGIHILHSINTTIRNNRIYNVFLNGILIHGDCMYAEITNNFVDGTTNLGIEVEGRSGGLGTTEPNPCSNITIIGNQLYNCGDGGMNINFSNGINVIGNIIKYSRIGINCISNQDVVISSNIVVSNGSALMIDQEFFGDISLTNSNIIVTNNSFSGGIANNLTGQEHVIKALVPIQNALNVKLVNNTFRIHRLVNNRDKDNDCVIAILSSKYIKVLNNQISGFTDNLPTKYNTGIIIGRSYNVVQTENWFEVTDELQQIPSDIKIDNNTIGNLVYGISTIIPNSTEAVPYTDGVENKAEHLQIYNNTIKECVYDVNIGKYCTDWKIEDNILINVSHKNYPSFGTTSEIPSASLKMIGAVKGMKYFNTSLGIPIFWSGENFRGNGGWIDSNGGSIIKSIPKNVIYFGNSLLSGFDYGMAATSVDKDYYYYVSNYFKDRNLDVNQPKFTAYAFETAENDSQVDSAIWPMMLYFNSHKPLAIIILCGDNVNTAEQLDYFTLYGAKRLLQTVRQYNAQIKIYWVGLWFNKSNVYDAIVEACNEVGATLIDIRDLSTYVSSIGTVHKYSESATYTKQNVTNVSVDGDAIIVTFQVDGTDYTTTIKCSSHSLSDTTLTFTGYETYIDDYGESIHPNNSGFKLIANRILKEVEKDF